MTADHRSRIASDLLPVERSDLLRLAHWQADRSGSQTTLLEALAVRVHGFRGARRSMGEVDHHRLLSAPEFVSGAISRDTLAVTRPHEHARMETAQIVALRVAPPPPERLPVTVDGEVIFVDRLRVADRALSAFVAQRAPDDRPELIER